MDSELRSKKPEGNLPPQIQHALRKNAEKAQPDGPRLAFTGNTKLDELLAGIKETIYKYEEVTLPSLGKFYDQSTAPPDGLIHVRCMTGDEDEILATLRHIKKGQAINMIYKNCVRETINPEQLLTIDRTWLLIYLRGISFSTDYECEVRCTECGSKFTEVINLDSLNVKQCPADFSAENLTATLPKSGYRINYRLATGKDENLIQEHREQRIKKNDDGTDDTWSFRAALLTKDIEGLTDRAALQTLMKRLPIQDVAFIRSLLTEPPFGVETRISILCKNCTEPFEIEMPMDANFFFPKPRKVSQ